MKMFFFFVLSVTGILGIPSFSEGIDDERHNFPQDIDSRILKGLNATIEDYPYQLSVRYFFQKTFHNCGGSIITLTRGLTAASYMTGASASYSIKAGTPYRIDQVEQKAQVRVLTRYLNHPEYNLRFRKNDISILYWDTLLVIDNTVLPVVLARANHEIPYGQLGYIAGWGRNDTKNHSLPDALQATRVPVITNLACREMYNGFAEILDTMICAGSPDSGTSACSEDYGGPLVQRVANSGDNRFIQIGVMSFSKGCGHTRSPTVHTSIPHFFDWIQANW